MILDEIKFFLGMDNEWSLKRDADTKRQLDLFKLHYEKVIENDRKVKEEYTGG